MDLSVIYTRKLFTWTRELAQALGTADEHGPGEGAARAHPVPNTALIKAAGSPVLWC